MSEIMENGTHSYDGEWVKVDYHKSYEGMISPGYKSIIRYKIGTTQNKYPLSNQVGSAQTN